MKKTLTILGSTGSVGVNTLRVAERFPESFEVRGLAAGRKTELLKTQIGRFRPSFVYIDDPEACLRVSREHPGRVRFFSRAEGLLAFSQAVDADILMAATTGTTALLSVLDALRNGKRVALSNKEILVMAGNLVMKTLRAHPKSSLIPVDSEHSAIFQCLQGNDRTAVDRLILTSSGGPLKDLPQEQFAGISKDIVTNHPKWRMGKKISVDSATLMNKGLEVIEAAWLFDLPIEKIDVLIHPQAVIHSMVEFVDGSLLAQLGVTDMRLPIQYALSHPGRLPGPPELKFRFHENPELTFMRPDRKKFPCLDLAREAAKRAGSAPCVLSAADETAVEAFLEDTIDFTDIPVIIERVLSGHRPVEEPDLEAIQSIHSWAVEETKRLCQAP